MKRGGKRIMETVSIRYKQTEIYSVFENAELMNGEMQESGFAKWLGTITVALSAPRATGMACGKAC
jgi:hypothetical protein